jgi:DNA processing protein
VKTISDAAWAALAWSRIPGLTPRAFWDAIAAAGDWRGLIGADPSAIAGAVHSEEMARAITRPFETDVAEELKATRKAGAAILTPFEGPYPRLLREIPDAPLVLYARGRLEKLDLPAVGIVGARASTHYGQEVAAQIGADLSAAGVLVVSGMARGIDAAAHRAALPGPGGTGAVLGCGLSIVYPAENAALWGRVEREGILLTEYPLAMEPLPRNFPIRNRIIAGMASAVVVVEAARRSGSLITARYANEFGRDVFAVPGSIHSETSEGCHALLRDGAILCRGAQDVLSEIFPSIGTSRVLSEEREELSGAAARIFEELQREEACSADDLAEATRLPVAELLTILFDLEVRGYLRALPGSLYTVLR